MPRSRGRHEGLGGVDGGKCKRIAAFVRQREGLGGVDGCQKVQKNYRVRAAALGFSVLMFGGKCKRIAAFVRQR